MVMIFRTSNVLLVVSVLSIGACVSYLASMFVAIVSFKRESFNTYDWPYIKMNN